MSERSDRNSSSPELSAIFSEESGTSDSQLSSAESSPFRGFQKIPKVVLSRLNLFEIPDINITTSDAFKSVLENRNQSKPNDSNRNENGGEPSQFINNCTVLLKRENLLQLKKIYLENSLRNKCRQNEITNVQVLCCKICNKAYGSEKALQSHQESIHMFYKDKKYKTHKRVSFSDQIIIHEVEYPRCRKCSKIFSDYKMLKHHMKHYHQKLKCYICYYCADNFVDRKILKAHIKLHCDKCGLLLPDKRGLVEHRRESCRTSKKYICKICNNSYFNYMDLKEHSYDHLEKLFICDICKDQLSSKCAVSHHTAFLHSKMQPESLYRVTDKDDKKIYVCRFCDESTEEREFMENHVSVLPDLRNSRQTGPDDFFFCDQCLMKFNSETAMLQHKWTHFLNKCDSSHAHQRNFLSKPQLGFKRTFKMNEKLPVLMQPTIVLERLSIDLCPSKNKGGEEVEGHTEQSQENDVEFVDVQNNMLEEGRKQLLDDNKKNLEEDTRVNVIETGQQNGHTDAQGNMVNFGNHQNINRHIDKPIIDPISKKTLLSRFQCEKCNKYYSSNSSLTRHMVKMHNDYSKLRCNVCEETFVWLTLLKSHKCIRLHHQEMPFEDSRPEIQLENYNPYEHANDLSGEDHMMSDDFEMPAPIVQLVEYDDTVDTGSILGSVLSQANGYMPLHNNYKIIVQEVPIEF